jgi:hypothetical protein
MPVTEHNGRLVLALGNAALCVEVGILLDSADHIFARMTIGLPRTAVDRPGAFT